MPDHRAHRGPHPEDARLFSAEALAALRAATGDLAWLLSRGYAAPSAVKVVGDRYRLDARQRTAVTRCTCTDAARDARRSRRVAPDALAGRSVEIDGYNLLTTVEAALGGGVVLVGRDGAHRDMASMHGTWRGVDETRPALRLIGRTLASSGVVAARWLLDRPVSNSGRLKAAIAEVAAEEGWAWDAKLVPDPDRVLARSGGGVVVVTADSVILDAAGRWADVAGEVVRRHVAGAWVVDLGGGG